MSITVWVSGDAYRRMREFADEHTIPVADLAGRLLERASAPRRSAPEPAGTAAVEMSVEERRDLLIRQGRTPAYIAAQTGIKVQKIYRRRAYLRTKDAS